MRNVKRHHSSVQTFCMVAVFAVFAILSVLLTLMGARVYKQVTQSMQANNALRSSLSYVANKIHSCGESETVYLEQQDGQPVLTIRETWDGQDYLTRIFFYQGTLREYASVDQGQESFSWDSGDSIARLQAFSLEQEGDLLTMTATAENGRTLSLTIGWNGGEGTV